MAAVRFTMEEALAAVEDFRHAVEGLDTKLLTMHKRGAHYVLGFNSWAEFVDAKFNISASQSYVLLDRARLKDRYEKAAVDVSALSGTVTDFLKGVGDDVRGQRVLEAVRLVNNPKTDKSITRDMVERADRAWESAKATYDTDTPTAEQLGAEMVRLEKDRPPTPPAEEAEAPTTITQIAADIERRLTEGVPDEERQQLETALASMKALESGVSGRPPGRPRGIRDGDGDGDRTMRRISTVLSNLADTMNDDEKHAVILERSLDTIRGAQGLKSDEDAVMWAILNGAMTIKRTAAENPGARINVPASFLNNEPSIESEPIRVKARTQRRTRVAA